ncbi:glutaminyl-peptide cyclotransferase [Chitinophagaceae bacterium 26-R-25]|nr:glutaminyl-peptide cyclotransferase [Chitinophagaceae bacterium 26-R-25]
MKFTNIASTFFAVSLIAFSSCNNEQSSTTTTETVAIPAAPLINYSVVNQYPHDASLFTEGLLFYNGTLYESTGSPKDLPLTKSLVVAHNLSNGHFDTKIELDKTKYFGEGIVFLNDKLYQLTYKNQTGFIYDAKTFKKIGDFKYSNIEGWGMTTDGTSLILSDGTDKLTYLNPKTLTQEKILSVTDSNTPLESINELEFIKGFIYANVWQQNVIVKIDPSNGKVVGKIDLGSLVNEAKTKNPNVDVLNGIAYDPATDKVYVTGKLWENIYEIKFAH